MLQNQDKQAISKTVCMLQNQKTKEFRAFLGKPQKARAI
jgi:hypothetical protein